MKNAILTVYNNMIHFKKTSDRAEYLKNSKNYKGFSLMGLLAVIAIIGLLLIFAGVIFSNARISNRDSFRARDISIIKRALAEYLNGSQTGYPASSGECFTSGSGVGRELVDSEVLTVSFPVDPLWPTTAPAHTDGLPNAGQVNFCYFYFSDARGAFRLSYFLESSSSAGPAGINTITER